MSILSMDLLSIIVTVAHTSSVEDGKVSPSLHNNRLKGRPYSRRLTNGTWMHPRMI